MKSYQIPMGSGHFDHGSLYKCEHGKTIFESCDACEIIWLEKHINVYETKLAHRRQRLQQLLAKVKT